MFLFEHDEVLVFDPVADLPGFHERAFAVERDGEPLVEEILVERDPIGEEGAPLALQLDLGHEITGVQVKAEVFREVELKASEDAPTEALVGVTALLTAQLDVIDAAIHEETDTGNGHPVEIEEKPCLAPFADIAEGGHRYVRLVRFHEDILFDGVVDERVADARVHVEFRVKQRVIEIDAVALLRLKIGITIRDVQRITLIDIGIQVIDKYRRYNPEQAERDKSNIERMIQSVTGYSKRVLVPYKDRILPIKAESIAYFYNTNGESRLTTLEGTSYPLAKSLDALMKKLDPNLFFRANRQFLISREAVESLTVWFDSRLRVNLLLPVPEPIYVAKNRASDFKSWLSES